MEQHQQNFLEFAIDAGVLKFGEYILKSGRTSPYFFNAGLFNSGRLLSKLGEFYADTIENSKIEYDVLFGPAYKGIPLVAATAYALSSKYGHDASYCFNRKEAKGYGERGLIVGSKMEGKVLVIDDVITAGTAIKEAAGIIDSQGAELAGVVISLDRQERGAGDTSAIQEIEKSYSIPVISIATLNNLIEYMHGSKEVDIIKQYQIEYGV